MRSKPSGQQMPSPTSWKPSGQPPSLGVGLGVAGGDVGWGRGVGATVAVGFTRFGTFALARAARGVAVCAHERIEMQQARQVALDRLDLPPQSRDMLDKLGVRTVGAFIDLPAPGIRRRFGEEAAQLHALAAGEAFAPLQPVIEAEPLIVDHALELGQLRPGLGRVGLGQPNVDSPPQPQVPAPAADPDCGVDQGFERGLAVEHGK